jgi:phosphoribosylaminoimidazole carboxylase (NCAIR synthetase)
MGALWILNLDAEAELERPDGYNPTAKMAALVAELAPAAAGLLGPDDERLTPGVAPRRGQIGKAWCPTPRAQRLLRQAGARPEPAPPLAVLRKVNHRRFCFDLGFTLPESRFCDSGTEALAELERCAGGGPWLVKRPFGFAGRGQRRITAVPIADDRRWLHSEGSRDGLLIEPFVDIVRELAIHGFLSQNGELTLGRVCEQRCDAQRAWQSTRLAENLGSATSEQLTNAAERTADALRGEGYFGPFGIDAYENRDAEGALRLNPLGEINARYTMGYAIGMRRP